MNGVKNGKKVIHEHRLSAPLMVILGIFAFGVVMIGIEGYLIKDAIAKLIVEII